MQQIQHPPIQKAYQDLRTLSADKKAWYQELAREMALRDEATLREEARELEARGEAKGQTVFLLHLLQTKFSQLPDFVEARVQQATTEQLTRWGERVLSAETIEQVFSEH